MKKYILTIDQGTTSSRAILFDKLGDKICVKQMEFNQITPQSGWVLHNPDEIYYSVLEVIKAVINESKINPNEIECIGITNQRETSVIWNKDNYEAIYPAIVWQSRQSEDICNELINSGYKDLIHSKTGLLINPYFSASKFKWILDRYDADKTLRNTNSILCGTIDTYLLYRLTQGKSFKTDYTNASRTMLFNINTLTWDDDLLELFGINKEMLPEVCDTSSLFGYYNYKGVDIPITSMVGDQQASLFGHIAFDLGDTKITYGTGCFMLMNTKENKIFSQKGLLTTIAYKIGDDVCYALEGSVFVAGSAVQWLRDGLKIIKRSKDTEEIIETVKRLAPTFGGINLEDISAPRCFEIETRLKKELDIPVFHDDQHGTAIVVCAGLINALKVVKKEMKDIRVVINGAGSAGISICKLVLQFGVGDVVLVDKQGALCPGEEWMNPAQKAMAEITNKDKQTGPLKEIIKDKDVFIGVSAPNLVTAEMVQTMAKDPVIFAMANPTPEIMPDVAKEGGARVVATGRSDFPNQINNVLVFPGIFRGALDVRAKEITEDMKIAAAKAIASLVTDEELNEEYIIPSPFDKRVCPAVAKEVGRVAREQGIARI